jgi:hypothetical protein
MKILGIELKSSTIIAVLLEDQQIQEFPNKIELKDSYDSDEIRQLFQKLNELFTKADIDQVIIKKRMEKGKFAGGAASFKLEGLIQLSTDKPVSFIAGTQIKAFEKKADADLSQVKKYQEQAYLAALTLIK